MADPYISEIRMLPFLFAPVNWAFCNGQTFPILQNTTLFSLIDTLYGGDGRYNFRLPNMKGRTPMGVGQGPGLTRRVPGELGGYAEIPLTHSQMPRHQHAGTMIMSAGTSDDPAGLYPGVARNGTTDAIKAYGPNSSLDGQLATEAIGATGGSQPHNNAQPWLTVNFCICLDGTYPLQPTSE